MSVGNMSGETGKRRTLSFTPLGHFCRIWSLVLWGAAPSPHQTHGKVAPAGQHEHTGSSLTHRARRVCDHTVGTEYFFFLADRVLIREQALPRPVMGQCV